MIYITGDTHTPIDIHKLKNQFFNPPGATKNNTYLIICGDFGAVWNYKGEDKEEKYWLDWLENKPYTVLFVDGNHECHPRLNAFPVEEWNGGKIHRIRPSVIHLMRGQIYTINGKKILLWVVHLHMIRKPGQIERLGGKKSFRQMKNMRKHLKIWKRITMKLIMWLHTVCRTIFNIDW